MSNRSPFDTLPRIVRAFAAFALAAAFVSGAAAQAPGALHAGSVQGPRLTLGELPYSIPAAE